MLYCRTCEEVVKLADDLGVVSTGLASDPSTLIYHFDCEQLLSFANAIEAKLWAEYASSEAVGTVYRIPLHSGFMASIDNSRVKEFDKLYLAPPNYEALQDKLSIASAAIRVMVEDGWLYHGEDGMDDTQQKVYDAHRILAAISGNEGL